MSSDTIPAALPGPTDPPAAPSVAAPGASDAQSWLASLIQPIEPARPTSGAAQPGGAADPAPPDGIVTSTPGVTSADFRTDQAEEDAKDDASGAKRKAQGSIWKAWWLAGAQRLAKGGGTANKRIDLAKAKAQAHQVKEARTTTVNKSGGLPPRAGSASGGGAAGKGADKPSSNSTGKGPANKSPDKGGPAGRGGSGSGGGPGRGSGGSGAPGSGGKPAGGTGSGGGPKGKDGGSGKGSDGKPGAQGKGKDGAAGKGADGKAGKGGPGSPGKGAAGGSGGSKNGGSSGSGNQGAGAGGGKKPGDGGGSGRPGGTGSGSSGPSGAPGGDPRTPLEKSREVGHGDGTKARRVVDHVKAYKDGVHDGWVDEKGHNAAEHDRLDKAHDKHKPKTPAPKQGTDTDEDMEETFMSKKTPIQVTGVDEHKLTLGIGALKGSMSRRELRGFKDYEGRLESRIDGMVKIAGSTQGLAQAAHKQAEECQQLADAGRGVEGGERTVAELEKLAEAAKVQAEEADEINKLAVRAADFARAVLSNIQTRYAPLYQAVVDSDETKPAELRFYTDRGYTPTALAA